MRFLTFCLFAAEILSWKSQDLPIFYGMNTRPFSIFFRLKREYTGFPIKGARYHFLLFISPFITEKIRNIFHFEEKAYFFLETLYFWALNFCRDTPDLNWHRDTMNAQQCTKSGCFNWFAENIEDMIRHGHRVDTMWCQS